MVVLQNKQTCTKFHASPNLCSRAINHNFYKTIAWDCLDQITMIIASPKSEHLVIIQVTKLHRITAKRTKTKNHHKYEADRSKYKRTRIAIPTLLNVLNPLWTEAVYQFWFWLVSYPRPKCLTCWPALRNSVVGRLQTQQRLVKFFGHHYNSAVTCQQCCKAFTICYQMMTNVML